MEHWTRARFLPGLPLGKDGRRLTAGKEHIELSKEAARDGMVLLKNRDATLPLAPGARVALFGKAVVDYVKGGGGSGDVNAPYVRSLAEGLSMCLGEENVFAGTVDFYRREMHEQYDAGRLPGLTLEPELPAELLEQAAAFADTAVFAISRYSAEGWDRRAEFDPVEVHKGPYRKNIAAMSNEVYRRSDFYLTDAERAVLDAVSRRFAKTVVVLNVGGITETASLEENDRIGAVLLAWQGGMEGGLAMAELLCGAASPCGRLCDTFARELTDYPGTAHFYDSDDYVEYTEDVYVGYRYFQTIPGAAEKVVYPFGWGLSYTEFAFEDARMERRGDEIELSVTVRNAGAAAAREVVQIYVSAPQGRLGKPARVLAGYEKTALLAPGEQQRVSIRVSMADLASYDDLGKVSPSAWVLEAGQYVFYIGKNVRDASPVGSVTLERDRIVKKVKRRMAPHALKQRLLADGTMEPLPLSEPPKDENVLEPMDKASLILLDPAVRAEPRRVRDKSDMPQLAAAAEGKIGVDELLDAMSDEDLAWLLGGQSNTGLANTYGYGNNRRFGIPNLMTADGPAGVRFYMATGVRTTAFPCGTLLACTWDREIARRVGEAAAEECVENNVFAWLAPGVCIHRSPLCGRNFEYYSEDPLLAGEQAAALVQGVQSRGAAATVKHLALNDKEYNRKESDSRASERAIREIYLKQFEIVVKKADPWSIMTSYNRINGVRASENAEMLTGILREEWGWEGMVVTDWWTYGEHYKETAAGNDVKMGCGYPERLLEAIEKGALTREQMVTCARRVLNFILRVDRAEKQNGAGVDENGFY